MRKTHLPSIHSWHEVKISDHLWSQRPTITGDTFSRGQVTKVRQFTQPNISRSRQGVWVPLFHGKRTMVNQDFIISRVQPAYVFPNSIWSFLETCPSWKAWRSISCTLLLYLCSREKLVCFAHHYICAGRSSKFCNCLSPLPDYVTRNVAGENHDHVFFFPMFEQNLGTSILRWMSLPPPRCRLALLPLSVSLSRWEYCIALEIKSKCHVLNE